MIDIAKPVASKKPAAFPFLINGVSRLNLNPGVDYHNGFNSRLFQLRKQARKIGKPLFVDCEDFVFVHIIDVKIDNIKRDAAPTERRYKFPDFPRVAVRPAALMITQSPNRGKRRPSREARVSGNDVADRGAIYKVIIKLAVIGRVSAYPAIRFPEIEVSFIMIIVK